MKLTEFSKRFESEAACEQYPKEAREKAGVVCCKYGQKGRRCGHVKMKSSLA